MCPALKYHLALASPPFFSPSPPSPGAFIVKIHQSGVTAFDSNRLYACPPAPPLPNLALKSGENNPKDSRMSDFDTSARNGQGSKELRSEAAGMEGLRPREEEETCRARFLGGLAFQHRTAGWNGSRTGMLEVSEVHGTPEDARPTLALRFVRALADPCLCPHRNRWILIWCAWWRLAFVMLLKNG